MTFVGTVLAHILTSTAHAAKTPKKNKVDTKPRWWVPLLVFNTSRRGRWKEIILPSYPELFLKLITDAIGITSPKVKRTRHELETTEGSVATGWGRPMDSTSKEPSKEEESSTTKSETESLDIHKQYHNDPSKHQGCCGFTKCRTAPKTSHDKDIYILTGRKVR